jgi:REP element-mobilizing transposase RayT
MPRRPRTTSTVYRCIVQRGHNRGACFFDDRNRHAYLGWLRDALQRERCQLHAYVLMTNHVHLLLTPEHATSVPRLNYLGGAAIRPIYQSHLWANRHTLGRGKRGQAQLIQGSPKSCK